MHLVDVLIHLDQSIGKTEERSLIEQLRTIQGVVAPRLNKEGGQLLLVSYNSDTTSSLALLNKVKNNGHKAQLVGL